MSLYVLLQNNKVIYVLSSAILAIYVNV